MNKQKIIFQFTDKTLTVYQWSSGELSTDSVYYLHKQEDLELFTQNAHSWTEIIGYVLLNLSSEEYHEEQLPHILGKDRKLMLKRKLSKLYPESDYTQYKFLKRQKTGRRDDIFLLSGIADTDAIEPYVDVINSQKIEISGVYSTPLIINKIIKPLKHEKKVLVIATGKPAEHRLPFRQTFLNGKLIHFNRLTSITTSGEPDDLAEKFNREIERSWQYLNNRKELTQGVDLEVILIVPDNVESALSNHSQVPHCQYRFAKLDQLIKLHQAENKIQHPHFASFTAFLLSKSVYKTPHYKPKKLAFVRMHKQARRYLLAASIFLAVLTLGITGNNLLKNHRMNQTSLDMGQTLVNNSDNIDSLESWFDARKTSPEKMETIVTTARKLTETNPQPESIFKIISSSYSNYSDLSLKTVEWKTVSSEETANDTFNNDDVDSGFSDIAPPSNSNKVLITLEGEVLNFRGNYRDAIEHIQDFANDLQKLTTVSTVNIHKLPLDINPTTIISRSINDQTPPSFAMDVELTPEAL